MLDPQVWASHTVPFTCSHSERLSNWMGWGSSLSGPTASP